MTYKLFLDDERLPVDNSWIIFRDVETAMSYIRCYGSPTHMSLDHDLGDNVPTGYDFVKQYVDYLLENSKPLVDFYVHSQNPIGKTNMITYWENYLKHTESM